MVEKALQKAFRDTGHVAHVTASRCTEPVGVESERDLALGWTQGVFGPQKDRSKILHSAPSSSKNVGLTPLFSRQIAHCARGTMGDGRPAHRELNVACSPRDLEYSIYTIVMVYLCKFRMNR